MKRVALILFFFCYAAMTAHAAVTVNATVLESAAPGQSAVPVPSGSVEIQGGVTAIAEDRAIVTGPGLLVIGQDGKTIRVDRGQALLRPGPGGAEKFYSIYQNVGTAKLLPPGPGTPDPDPDPQTSEVQLLTYCYTRMLKATNAQTVNGIAVSSNGVSMFDQSQDVGRLWNSIKESDVVCYDGSTQSETIIYSCIADDNKICSANSPVVSPDGNKIAFWVAFSDEINPYTWNLQGQILNPVIRAPTKVQIFIHDFTTGLTTGWTTPDGRIDAHPDWISNTKLVFTSNRDGLAHLYTPQVNQYQNTAFQPHTADIDGSNVRNIGKDEDVFIRPLVLSDGTICGSSWRMDGQLGLQRGDGQQVTKENQMWLVCFRQDGSGKHTILGAHGLQIKHKDNPAKTENMFALRRMAELTDGRLAVADYYRSNHVTALGQVWTFDRPPWGVEVQEITPVNPYGQEDEIPPARDPATGQFYGKATAPSAMPNNQLVITYANGFCLSTWTDRANDAYLSGGPGCDAGIYVTTQIPSTDPTDLIKIVDSDVYHEFTGVVVLPKSAIHGVDEPVQYAGQNRVDGQGAPLCSLDVIDATYTQFMTSTTNSYPCTKTGACIDRGRDASELQSVAIHQVPWNTVRQEVRIANGDYTLGSLPRENHENIQFLGYCDPEPDGSMSCEVPCGVMIRMSGSDGSTVDTNGDGIFTAGLDDIFMRDQIKHALADTGEARVCDGCHGGHTITEHQQRIGNSSLEAVFAQTQAGQLSAPRQLRLP